MAEQKLVKEKCPDCGTPCEPDDSFCPECGKYLKATQAENSSLEEGKLSIQERKETMSKIKEHLGANEKILGVFKSKDDKYTNTWWYATSKRVIKLQSGFGEKIVSLPYKQISSTSLETTPSYFWLIIVGLFFLLLGWLSWRFFTAEGEDLLLKIFVLVVFGIFGILFIIIGAANLHEQTYYRFTGSGLDEKEWRVQYKSNQNEIVEFMKIVEKRLG